MTDRVLLQQALEALEEATTYTGSEAWSPSMTRDCEKAITALRTALEQPEQEPVATVTSETGAEISMSWWHEPALPIGTKLYTAPPQRKPLSLDELWRVFTSSGLSQFHQRDGVVEYKYEKCIEEFARAIEAAHNIKE